MNDSGERFDASTLATLEFPDVIEQIVKHATCEPGVAAVRGLRPLEDRALCLADLRLVDDAVSLFQAGRDFGFGGAVALDDALDRAALGSALAGAELSDVARTERALAAATITLAAVDHVAVDLHGRPPRPDDASRAHARADVAVDLHRRPPRPDDASRAKARPLHDIASQRRPTDSLIRKLETAIGEDGTVLDGASSELARLRRQQRSAADEVRRRIDDIIRNPNTAKLLSEQIVTVRRGRFVVPVRVEFAAQFNGVVHDQSASGATVFIEPMACVEANNRLRGLEAAEEREVQRMLSELSALVGSAADDLRANGRLLARLDSIGARARWANARSAIVPDLTDGRSIRIVHGRHPLLRREAVPLDVDVGADCDAVIISGPNMGGKTVVLKTIGLFCMLAYAGIPLPASAGTQIGWFDTISCIIGDDQSIANDLSSFSAHLRALDEADRSAGPRALVLVDEIGSGTEPGAGAALAQAFVEALLAAGARIVVTTHYTQLKIFAASRERVANASMTFDPKSHQPTYELAMGVPGQSLAFALASSLGLDPGMIARADALLGADARNLERAFEGLAAERERLQAKAADAEAELQRLRAVETELRAEAAAATAARAQFERAAQTALERAVLTVREELIAKSDRSERDARRQRARIVGDADEAVKKTMTEIRESLGLDASSTVEPALGAFSVGDSVYVRSFGQSGVVSEVYDRDVLVTMGAVKAVVPRGDLTRDPATTVAGAGRAAPGRSHARSDQDAGTKMASLDASTSIDVRGMRVDEAMPVVDKALDDASLAGLSSIRIIHGKGTGQLGRGIREFLRGHLQVDSTAFAPDREGGTGVTVVTLR